MNLRPGNCPWCGRWTFLRWHESNTAYADPDSNFKGYICRDCAEEDDEYWNERWAEYHSMSR